MTDKTIKFIGLLLLFNVVMACVFRLRSPSPPVPPAAGNPVPAGTQSSVALYRQALHLERNSVRVSRPLPADSLPESGDEILHASTNEDEVLNRLRSWARADPEAALIWGRQQTNEAERSEALTDACFQIAGVNPERALALAEQFNLSQDAALENLAQQWAAKDLTAAYSWIMRQPADDRRNAMMTGMTFIWSQTEPAVAAQFVAQQMSPGAAQDEAVMMVLHQWALGDATGAGAWVQQFPESPLRDRALHELAGIEQYKHGLAQSE